MITHNHIKYLKDALEPDGDAYPYHELYEWDDKFLEAKIHPDLQKLWDYKWDDRYCSLKLTTIFFNNLSLIDSLLWNSKSIEDFLIQADLQAIPREAVNFAICYCWMCPGRFFSYDWRKLDDLKDQSDYIAMNIPPFNLKESISWSICNNLFKEITRKNLPMLEVDEFMKLKLA